jgi:hypothetical protein
MSILVTRPVYDRVRDLVTSEQPQRLMCEAWVGLNCSHCSTRRSYERTSDLNCRDAGLRRLDSPSVFRYCLVAFSELVLVLDRASHPLAGSLRRIRTWVLPLIAAVFSELVVLLPSTSLPLRLAETLCWAAVIVSIISVVNNLVFETRTQGTWQSKVPRLLRDLLRLMLVGVGLAIVYSVVWGRKSEAPSRRLASLPLSSASRCRNRSAICSPVSCC